MMTHSLLILFNPLTLRQSLYRNRTCNSILTLLALTGWISRQQTERRKRTDVVPLHQELLALLEQSVPQHEGLRSRPSPSVLQAELDLPERALDAGVAHKAPRSAASPGESSPCGTLGPACRKETA